MNLARVTRWIRGFDERGELAVEYQLPAERSIERLRELFAAPEDDPMIYSYPLGARGAGVLGADLGRDLGSRRLVFFLEADSDVVP